MAVKGAMTERDQTCKNCRYWKPKSGNYGECRKYAPKSGDGIAKFPITLETTWCGEFEATTHSSRCH
jgi:hypothetical protein